MSVAFWVHIVFYFEDARALDVSSGACSRICDCDVRFVVLLLRLRSSRSTGHDGMSPAVQ